jgi:ribosomal protein S18 acetylase RimI-like enzyme
MDLEPESLFVAVADGALVGYLTGCVDSAAFPRESARIEDAIRKYRLVFRPRSMGFFGRAVVDAARVKLRKEPSSGEFDDQRWPSHLHINVAPEARGTGAGSALMNAWFERLTAAGSPGCHLQTLVENQGAIRFFQRMGFAVHGPTPLVPGVRYQGKKLHQQTMVYTVPRLS